MINPAPITVKDFQDYFDRDFDYTEQIRTKDIENAILQAKTKFPARLAWGGDDIVKNAFLYLTAHYVISNVKAGGGNATGLNSQGRFTASSKSVDGVSQTNVIPDKIAQHPSLWQYLKTSYGQIYLELMPPLIANVMIVESRTNA